MKYKRNVCGCVCDPAQGDPTSGVPENTPFENLRADWVCPVCGAGKDEFSPAPKARGYNRAARSASCP